MEVRKTGKKNTGLSLFNNPFISIAHKIGVEVEDCGNSSSSTNTIDLYNLVINIFTAGTVGMSLLLHSMLGVIIS